jgi:hypothetical protein
LGFYKKGKVVPELTFLNIEEKNVSKTKQIMPREEEQIINEKK